jgi:hypothetical protein
MVHPKKQQKESFAYLNNAWSQIIFYGETLSKIEKSTKRKSGHGNKRV